MNEKITKIATEIADKLLELNGLPKEDSYFKASYSYLHNDKPIYEFRLLDHQNENKKHDLESVFYVGISNNHFSSKPQEFNKSLVEGEFINNKIKELLGNEHKINYENQLTQTFGTTEKNPSKQLYELTYAVNDIVNQKIQAKVGGELSDHHTSRTVQLTQDFEKAKAAPLTRNVSLMYDSRPALTQAAIEEMKKQRA